jgi:hypothetical protein
MKNPIAFCGLDCSVCPAYVATQSGDPQQLVKVADTWSKDFKIPFTAKDVTCDGCQPQEGARLGAYCGECPMRACGMKKGYPNCAYCPDYACPDLTKFYGGPHPAKDRLDALRKQMGRS